MLPTQQLHLNILISSPARFTKEQADLFAPILGQFPTPWAEDLPGLARKANNLPSCLALLEQFDEQKPVPSFLIERLIQLSAQWGLEDRQDLVFKWLEKSEHFAYVASCRPLQVGERWINFYETHKQKIWENPPCPVFVHHSCPEVQLMASLTGSTSLDNLVLSKKDKQDFLLIKNAAFQHWFMNCPQKSETLLAFFANNNLTSEHLPHNSIYQRLNLNQPNAQLIKKLHALCNQDVPQEVIDEFLLPTPSVLIRQMEQYVLSCAEFPNLAPHASFVMPEIDYDSLDAMSDPSGVDNALVDLENMEEMGELLPTQAKRLLSIIVQAHQEKGEDMVYAPDISPSDFSVHWHPRLEDFQQHEDWEDLTSEQQRIIGRIVTLQKMWENKQELAQSLTPHPRNGLSKKM